MELSCALQEKRFAIWYLLTLFPLNFCDKSNIVFFKKGKGYTRSVDCRATNAVIDLSNLISQVVSGNSSLDESDDLQSLYSPIKSFRSSIQKALSSVIEHTVRLEEIAGQYANLIEQQEFISFNKISNENSHHEIDGNVLIASPPSSPSRKSHEYRHNIYDHEALNEEVELLQRQVLFLCIRCP